MSTIKSANPMKDIIALNFFGSFLREIPSIQVTSNCHPSSPGNGSKLKIAKLIEIIPQK